MNGPHDIGGMQCFGAVCPEADEPVFHADWEERALALTVAMGFCGLWNIDMSRNARESLRPEFYLSSSYYQLWIAGLETLMCERGLVTWEELKTGQLQQAPVAMKRVLNADDIPAVLAAGGPVERETQTMPEFSSGDRVVARNIHPQGHTRLPRYVRGKKGRIAHVHGCHVFPDDNARGVGENPKWLYCVEFDAVELFGDAADPGNTVRVDCWEPYLERS